MALKFRIFTTEDGSPTLIWSRDDGYEEKMHHSGGALTESLFIYQTALREALGRGWPGRVLSLGLGLGYNELIAAAEFMKSGTSDWKIWSFEAEDSLRENFACWLTGAKSELAEIYEDILRRTAASFEVSPAALFGFAREGLHCGKLELRGRFPEDAADVSGGTCVFYDAYSKKMDAGLWEENSLTTRLAPLLAPGCVLSTYAATGSMNRALKILGFRLLPRAGFLGKRESTLAIRE